MKENDIVINVANKQEYRVVEVKKKTVIVERDHTIHVMAKSDLIEKEN